MLDRISLDAFRVFDAACRHMNFSGAARELHVSQAAVSQRVRGLEEQLGAPLFLRRGKHLELTPKGERLSQRVRAALDYLDESLEPFRTPARRTITIAASGSVSHLWLGPRLRAFAERHPGLSLRLVTSDATGDLASDNNDLTILYSTGEHPRWTLTPLLPEVLAPVAAPGYLAERGLDAATLDPVRVAALDLLDYERFNAHWISFRQWFARLQPPVPTLHGGRLSFSTYPMAIEAAVRGDGVALGSLGLLDGLIGTGRLTVLGTARLVTGYGYHLGLPRERRSSDETLMLHGSLREAAPAIV
ncbi:LysR substrate-binding domain-containing protein [Ensifer soli]|uniref:LysR substrate-binding domain-containing protein n=1 Tax=Ciceribacter sp. sgz301302 TaxID=3342379 RepID=UPI0035BA40ED